MVALAEFFEFEASDDVEDAALSAGRLFWASRARDGKQGEATFTGYFSDSETGLLHARARMYNLRLGRFINRDPWRYGYELWRKAIEPRYKARLRPHAGDEYRNGIDLYHAHFIPGTTDFSGMADEACPGEKPQPQPDPYPNLPEPTPDPGPTFNPFPDWLPSRLNDIPGFPVGYWSGQNYCPAWGDESGWIGLGGNVGTAPTGDPYISGGIGGGIRW